MIQLSLIVSVLESYEVVRRQLIHLENVLTNACELIFVDDGSDPSLEPICRSVAPGYAFTYHATHDPRPWTQPRGRNQGAALAHGEKLLFFDIDHIVTHEIVQHALAFDGDKSHWIRLPGILDAEGRIVTDPAVLLEHGVTESTPSVHGNSFVIRRSLFDLLGGYDERFCGRYGGDDIDFNTRYTALCQQGLARSEELHGCGYVYPDPAHQSGGLFHSLDRVSFPH